MEELVFGTEATIGLSYSVLRANLDALKNKVTFLWNPVPTPHMEKFCHGTSAIASIGQCSWTDDHWHCITLSIHLCVNI